MTVISRTMRVGRYFLLFAATAWVSCGAPSKTARVPSPQKNGGSGKELSEEQLITLKYLFVDAKKESILGNKGKASELFAQCIRIDGRNDAAMYELAQIYADDKKINDAIFFAEGAYQLDRQNVWYRLFLAELYMSARKGQQGEEIYSGLFKEYPHNVDYAFKYAAALIYNGKFQDAIKVYDKVEDEIGINADLTIEKERLWIRLGKIDKAALELEKLITEDPQELRNYSLLVELYQVNEMPDKAYSVIERMQQVDPDSPFVYLALAEHYRSTNQKEKSFEQLKKAFASKQLEPELKFRIIYSYVPLVQGNPEMLAQGRELSQILADTHSDEPLALAINGDFLTMSDEYEKAITYYEASLALDKGNMLVWQQLLICEEQQNDSKAILNTSEEALSLFPDQSIFYLYYGSALSIEQRYQEAVKNLLAGSKLVVDNDYQKKQFYIRLADCYNSLKEYESSDNYFEKALELDKDDPLVLNNYSYYLSLRKEKLEKAESMSKRSNELRPGEASYEDTYGWILFVMGKYSDAKEWLQKAMDHGGDSNGTILEHMGDVEFKLGNVEKAVELWQKAKDTGDTGDNIDRKLKDKMFYE